MRNDIGIKAMRQKPLSNVWPFAFEKLALEQVVSFTSVLNQAFEKSDATTLYGLCRELYASRFRQKHGFG